MVVTKCISGAFREEILHDRNPIFSLENIGPVDGAVPVPRKNLFDQIQNHGRLLHREFGSLARSQPEPHLVLRFHSLGSVIRDSGARVVHLLDRQSLEVAVQPINSPQQSHLPGRLPELVVLSPFMTNRKV